MKPTHYDLIMEHSVTMLLAQSYTKSTPNPESSQLDPSSNTAIEEKIDLTAASESGKESPIQNGNSQEGSTPQLSNNENNKSAQLCAEPIPNESAQTMAASSEIEKSCLNPERALMLKRILIKVLIICAGALITLLLAPKTKANDHLAMGSLSAGVLIPNGLDITAQYEHSTSYHSAWAVELNGYLRWRTCPDCEKVCADSFWSYYHSYHLGLVYKPCVYRSRNKHGRLRIGTSIGYDDHHILGGVLLGYEQTYCLHYGCEFFWTAKADVQALAKNWVRPGLSIGIRLPL